jgi:hypothetical protein
MEPKVSYKLSVEVEGEQAYFCDAYSIEDLELHLGQAQLAADAKVDELITSELGWEPVRYEKYAD